MSRKKKEHPGKITITKKFDNELEQTMIIENIPTENMKKSIYELAHAHGIKITESYMDGDAEINKTLTKDKEAGENILRDFLEGEVSNETSEEKGRPTVKQVT